MALTAQQIADSLKPVVETVEVPALGGTVRVHANWGADPHYLAYVFGETRDPVDVARSINALNLGDDDKGTQRRTELWERWTNNHQPPSVHEIGVRRVVATLILCIRNEDDAPLWTWEDVDQVRGLVNSNLGATLTELAGKAWVLAAPETVEDAGKDSGPTPSS